LSKILAALKYKYMLGLPVILHVPQSTRLKYLHVVVGLRTPTLNSNFDGVYTTSVPDVMRK
jgi:hypothetical protein